MSRVELIDPRPYAHTEPVAYEDRLHPGDPLLCMDNFGAELWLEQYGLYHFTRWGNQSTLHLEEIRVENIGSVGFNPNRFVKVST